MNIIATDPHAGDVFRRLLYLLCAESLVIDIEPRSGGHFSAILIACGNRDLFYEGWSDVALHPNGDLGGVAVDDIRTIRIF